MYYPINTQLVRLFRFFNNDSVFRFIDNLCTILYHTTTGQQAFGIKSASSLEPAKGLIFPQDIDDTVEGQELYKRSHGSFAPGEQRRRGYDWNVDPEKTRFGAKGDTIAFNGVSKNIADVLNGSANADKNGVVNTKKVSNVDERSILLQIQ